MTRRTLGAGRPRRLRRPSSRVWASVPFGYRLDEIAQTRVCWRTVMEKRTSIFVGVEAAVGPYSELSCGPGAAYPAQRLTQEVCGAPGGVGPARSQPCHQHVSGSCGNGQQRVISPLAGVAVVAAGSLLCPVHRSRRRSSPGRRQRPVSRS